MTHKMVSIVVRAAGVRTVAAMRVWFHRQDSHRVYVAVPIPAVIRSLIFPIAALAVFRGVERVKSVVKIRPRRNHTRETLPLVKAARAYNSVWRARRQCRMSASVVR